MTKVTQIDLDQLLNQPYYSWHTVDLLSGVVDFLEFSERNLGWLRRRDIQKAEEEGAKVSFDPPDENLIYTYREQLIESAKYRFDVGLSQSIRYSGLVAFITALEFCATVFAKRIIRAVPPVPSGENRHIHLLTLLNGLALGDFVQQIEDLGRLVHVRNCVVHAAGFVEGYKHEKDVRRAAETLTGFSIWKEDYLGTSVCIGEGAVEGYARAAKEWLPKLDEKCTGSGILK